jgi:branched-chain amino acid transport system substrate-binding protein
MKSSLTAVAIAIVLAGTFLACDKKPAEIKIGGVGPLTGEAATFGVSTKNGYEMAVADANAKGGILGKQVKLIFADDKGDPAEGATVYTKLIEQDKVTAIIGTVMSKVCLAGAPICQNAQIPNIVNTASFLNMIVFG